MRFRILYQHVKTKLRFADLIIEADDERDAEVLAKYRIRNAGDEFKFMGVLKVKTQ